MPNTAIRSVDIRAHYRAGGFSLPLYHSRFIKNDCGEAGSFTIKTTQSSKGERMRAMKCFLAAFGDERSADVRGWFKNQKNHEDASIKMVKRARNADVILVAGGDGAMLHAIAKHWRAGKPFFGINRGTIGFLLNPIATFKDLVSALNSLEKNKTVVLELLHAEFLKTSGVKKSRYVFNDVTLERACGGMVAAKVWTTDSSEFKGFFKGDGIIISTAQGSTAYNRSVGGHILPLEENLLAISTICAMSAPFHKVIRTQKIKANVERGRARAWADSFCIKNVQSVSVGPSGHTVTLMFLPEYDFQLKRFKLDEACQITGKENRYDQR